ncbi:MAG: HD domain-containing phosphohydrolase [Syntrophotaleaceae bacterium]
MRKAVEANGWQIEAHNGSDGLACRLLIPRMALEMEEAALDMTMGRVLEFVSGLLGANTSSLMLCDQLSGDLVIRSVRGLDEEAVRGTRLRIGDRLAGWVAAEGQPLLVADIEDDPRFARGHHNPRYSSKSLLSVPLKQNGRVIGVLNLTDKHTGHAFTDKDLKIAQVVVERITAFIANLKGMASQGERDFRKIVASLDSLLSAEARYAKRNICYLELVDALMKELKASEREQETALYVALIYDLGLMLLDRRLLEKKNELSELEMTALQSHPFTTLELLQDFDCSEDVRHIILHHHEHFDGSGYPDGLAGEQIPLLSRVLAVVDSYCAMTEERPYRAAMGGKEALALIRKDSGVKYDPQIVEALAGVMASR